MAITDLDTTTARTLIVMNDGTVMNMADLIVAIGEAVVDGKLTESLLANQIPNLNVDASGRLRVSAEAVANIATVTTASTVGSTQIGAYPALAYSQLSSMQAFDLGFTSHLVVS